MKRLIAYLLMCSFAMPPGAFAAPAPAPEDGLLTQVLSKTAVSMLRDEARKQLLHQLEENLSEDLAAKIKLGNERLNQALTVYSIGKGLDGYGKSKSEQEKYFAAMGVISDTLTLIPPLALVGGIMQFALMGQTLVAGYISKDAMLRALEQMRQIEQVNQQYLDSLMKRTKGEYAYLQTLLNQVHVTLYGASIYSDVYQKQCTKEEDFADVSNVVSCVILARQISYLYKLSGSVLAEFSRTHLDALTLAQFFEINKTKPDVIQKQAEALITVGREGDKALAEIEQALMARQREAFEEAKREKSGERDLALACLNYTRQSVSPFLRGMKQFNLEDPVERVFVQGRLDSLAEGFNGTCGQVPEISIPPRTREYLRDLKVRLSGRRAHP